MAILLSTYNGEKYLKDQIESIRRQTYKNWQLFIRDDGSTDETTNIIQELIGKDDRVQWINRQKVKNVGVKESFIILLKETKANYYMFCDQDDVWLPRKIEVTLAAMKENSLIPQLVFTDLKLVDSDLKTLDQSVLSSVDINYWICPDNLLFDNIVTGCTVMINQALKDIVLPVNTDSIVMHDWWFAQIASQSGQINFVNQATILYRQHGDNQVGINTNLWHKFAKIRRFNKFRMQTELQIIQGNLSVQRTHFKTTDKGRMFLSMKDTKTIARLAVVVKAGFRKHTKFGSLALNIALMMNNLRKIGG